MSLTTSLMDHAKLRGVKRMPNELFFNIVSALIFAVGGLFFLLVHNEAAIGLRILFGFLSAYGFAELAYVIWQALRKRSTSGSSPIEDDES